MNPLTIAFLTAIRELYNLGPDSDGHGYEPRLSHATDWLYSHNNHEDLCRLLQRPHDDPIVHWCHTDMPLDELLKIDGDPYLFDLIPGAANEHQPFGISRDSVA